MATFVACVAISPHHKAVCPTYGSNEGDPNGAADTGPILPFDCKLFGKCGFRCFFTPIGPIPGPPPPCGMQKVLCKFK